MVGIAYQTCVEVGLGAISVIFHAAWQGFLPDFQDFIQDIFDLLAGLVRGE